MQVTTVNDAPACPKDNGRAVGGQANPGEFDQAMAALCAILSPTPVSVSQGQSNSGNETTSSNETSNLKLADPVVLLEGSKTAVAEKKPADNEAAGLNIENAVQTLTGVTNTVDMLNNPALQQNPAMIMAPVQNPQTAVLPFTGAGSAIQQSTSPGSGAVSAQSLMVADNANSNALISAAVQPEPGVAPPEALLVKTPVMVDPSQKGVQPPPEMEALAQDQLNGAIQESSPAKNKQKTTLVVADADGSKPAKEDEQPGIFRTGTSGSISPNEKPEIKGTLQEAKPAIALSSNQTAQPDGKEIKPGTGKDEAVKSLSESGTAGAGEKTKQFSNPQSNTTQHSTAQLNATQSNPAQFDQIPSVQSTGDVSKGVGLPDLKDRLVQEIKHFFTTYKGEPQTQVQLKLEPENLGQLTIKLYFNKGELNAHFYTGNSFVKDALEGSIQQLRDTLGQQDMRLNEALVFTGGDGSGGAGRYFGERNGREASAYGGYNHRTYGNAQIEPVEFVSTETEPSRVNYLI